MEKAKLIKIAKELNEVLGVEPAINLKASEKEIEKKIKQAAQLLEADDELTKVTQAGLEQLGIFINTDNAPEEEEEDDIEDVEPEEDEDAEEDEEDEDAEEDEEDEEDEEEPAPKKGKEKAPPPSPAKSKEKEKTPAPKKEKADKYTRIDSVCETLKGKKAKTMEELVEKSNQLYVTKGGKDNAKESAVISRMILQALSYFEELSDLTKKIMS